MRMQEAIPAAYRAAWRSANRRRRPISERATTPKRRVEAGAVGSERPRARETFLSTYAFPHPSRPGQRPVVSQALFFPETLSPLASLSAKTYLSGSIFNTLLYTFSVSRYACLLVYFLCTSSIFTRYSDLIQWNWNWLTITFFNLRNT